MNEHTNVLSRRAFMGGGSLLALSLFLNPTSAYGVTAAEKQAEAEAALASLNTMESKLDEAEANYHTAVSEQEEAQNKMDEAQARIDEVNVQLADLQDRLGTRARSMYRSGSTTFIDFLLGASSFQEFTQNWNILNQVNQNDADMVQEAKDLRVEIEAQKAEYEAQEKVAAEKAAEALEIKEEAEATVAAMQETYDSLSAEAARLLEEERAAREAAEAAEAARRAAESAAQAQQQQQNQSSNSGGGSSSSGGSSSGGGQPAYQGSDPYDRACSYLGCASYVWGACSPGAFDCSGFVSYCLTGRYSRVGTTYTFMDWPQVSDPQPGDVCTNWVHCGIYAGDGQMIHCSSSYNNIVRASMHSGMIIVRPPW